MAEDEGVDIDDAHDANYNLHHHYTSDDAMSNYSSVSSDSASIHELPADQRQQSTSIEPETVNEPWSNLEEDAPTTEEDNMNDLGEASGEEDAMSISS